MKILKSKKGIALENTIFFMMIIFSLCFLISSFTLLGHYQGEIENLTITNRVELDQIGEDFVANPSDFEETDYDNYQVESESNILKVWHKNDKNKENVLLYVEVDGDEVITWRYSDKPQ